MNIENDLQAIKRIFIDYPKQLKLANDELVKVSTEEKDLLHLLELGRLNAPQIMKVSRELAIVLRKRRDLKDEIEKLETIKHFNNRLREHEITNTIGRVRKLESRQTNRTYTMRVRSDLQELM